MKGKLFKSHMIYRILSITIALTMICVIFIPAATVTADSETETETTPLSLDSYITESGTGLYYKLPNSTDDEWITVGDNTIPGNANMKLSISYGNVPLDDLRKANNQMTYTLPEQFRHSDDIRMVILDESGNQSSAVLESSANSNNITLTFDRYWLDELSDNGHNTVSGSFYIELAVNWLKVVNPVKINDNIDITARFDTSEKMLAECGEADIAKEAGNLIKEDDKYYLEYTLTVTAGKYGVGGVNVIDRFTENADCVVGYVTDDSYITQTITRPYNGSDISAYNSTDSESVYFADSYDGNSIPAQSSNSTNSNVLVWEIGNMTPNEVRTLTYRVQVSEEYLTSACKETIENTADVKSVYNNEVYPKDSDTCEYTPDVDISVSKTGSANKNEDDIYVIDYQITVTNNNIYPIENLKVSDSFSGSYAPYASYDEESFSVKTDDGDETDIDKSDINFNDEKNAFSNDEKNAFSYEISSIAAGSTQVISYQAEVDPKLFAALGNKNGNLENSVKLTPQSFDDADPPLNSTACSIPMQKVWNRKIVGEPLENAETVNISGSEYYDATGKSISSITPEDSFTVPAGSFKYQAVINEDCDWDLSESTISDSLSSEYLKFVGYARINAYNSTNGTINKDGDSTVVRHFNDTTPSKTVWVKIENLQSFTFTPKDIGLTEGKCAYLITYYAQPNNTSDIAQINVTNKLEIFSAKSPDGELLIVDITASCDVTVDGDLDFDAKKSFWYYDPNDSEWYSNLKGSNDPDTGSLYWIIKVDGESFPEGMTIKDLPAGVIAYRASEANISGAETTVYNYVYGTTYGTSIVGGYIGNNNIIDNIITENIQNKSYFEQNATPIAESNFTITRSKELSNDFYNLCIKANNNITIPSGQSLYLVIRTRPSATLTYKRDALRFKNTLSISSDPKDENSWVSKGEVTTPYIYKNPDYLKQLGCVFTYNSNNKPETYNYSETYNAENKGTITESLFNGSNGFRENAKSFINESGTYVAWQIRLNYGGTLSDSVRVVDTLPAGTELAYVAYTGIGSSYTKPFPSYLQISEFENNSDYKQSQTVYPAVVYRSGEKVDFTLVYYYNSKTGEVVWEVNNLKSDSTGMSRDIYYVEYQVVCKVTDPDLLFGTNETERTKSLGNQLCVYQNDEPINSIDTDTVYFKPDKPLTGFSKTLTNPEVNSSKINFTIEVNKLAEDQFPDKDTITLIDELNENLILDPTSIKVVNQDNESDEVEFSYSFVGQTLKLDLPDEKHLIITYDTIVNGPPGTEISISNVAYWEGYDQNKVSYSNNNYTYAAGGSSSGSGGDGGGDDDSVAAVQVFKVDKDTGEKLSDAVFSLQQVEYDTTSNSLVPPQESSNPETATTDENGICKFDNLSTDTIYCLTETQAPEGYVLDSTPRYILFSDSKDFLSAFPDYIKEKIRQYYVQTTVTYPISNSTVEPTKLPVTGGMGTNIFLVIGGGLLITSFCFYYLSFKRRKKHDLKSISRQR